MPAEQKTQVEYGSELSLFFLYFIFNWFGWQSSFVCFINQDSRSCSQFNSCTLTIFCLRDKLHHDTAHLSTFCTGSNSRPLIKLIPQSRLLSINLVPGWQKTRKTCFALLFKPRHYNEDYCRLRSLK